MPKKYSELQKRDAMDLLDIHDDITVVHHRTGIPRRTLRHWRAKLRRKQKRLIAEKHIASATKRQQTDDNIPLIREEAPLLPAADTKLAPANLDPVESEETNDDLENLRHIRAKLMIFALRLADDLDPDDPDVNLRTLSLTRILDRIYWLDHNLDDGQDDESAEAELPNRMRCIETGEIFEQDPWLSTSAETD